MLDDIIIILILSNPARCLPPSGWRLAETSRGKALHPVTLSCINCQLCNSHNMLYVIGEVVGIIYSFINVKFLLFFKYKENNSQFVVPFLGSTLPLLREEIHCCRKNEVVNLDR